MEAKKQQHRLFGYFENGSEIPAYDPGINCECLICFKSMKGHQRKTHSLMLDGDARSFFYRTHKECSDNLSQSDLEQIESSLIDNI